MRVTRKATLAMSNARTTPPDVGSRRGFVRAEALGLRRRLRQWHDPKLELLGKSIGGACDRVPLPL